MSKISSKYGQGFVQVVERIKDATSTRTQVELANVLGIRQSSISDAKRRDSVPADWFLTLFRKFGLNPDWLAMGRGPKYIKTKEGYQPFDQPALSETLHEEGTSYGDPMAAGQVVSYYGMSGDLTEKGQWKPIAKGKIIIPSSFNRDSLLVVQVDGSGMEPLIRRKAIIGLDRDQKSVTSGEIYGVLVPFEGLVLRRIYFDSQANLFVLKAENPNHVDQHISIEDYSEKVVGRMVWMMQEA
ncbi:LexA family transcriptional regulator [Desulfobaculum bizertense]|uniref:Phage repressor protein C, contains Cro/C1-type HTH and peptisase s24 domains n=1 Tax=Desulfobaculum bizertense DSM 18034 TaxID=1121442 RepID=A0A1T4VG27_9BACT|nr:helix-turn-helix domain-containing protein [Desulfobaculum bizertense]UIJ37764.1 helix-turn-helix domain-containing protein [Desulfobaculum bizertense]SKA63887.1 Phage repressor protein C, contains Cro/C1-type HTH and peptisase s24 domains [Desulfobaculum bizertense DSM 18034]